MISQILVLEASGGVFLDCVALPDHSVRVLRSLITNIQEISKIKIFILQGFMKTHFWCNTDEGWLKRTQKRGTGAAVLSGDRHLVFEVFWQFSRRPLLHLCCNKNKFFMKPWKIMFTLCFRILECSWWEVPKHARSGLGVQHSREKGREKLLKTKICDIKICNFSIIILRFCWKVGCWMYPMNCKSGAHNGVSASPTYPQHTNEARART